METLEAVGGRLQIADNPILVGLRDLTSLDKVGSHIHCLGIDGVYVSRDDKEEPEFLAFSSPSNEDIQCVTETVAHRLIRLFIKRGLLEAQDLDPLEEESPALAAMTAASVQGLIATGERAGMRVRRLLTDPIEGIRTSNLCYASRGFSLHAATRVDAYDRERLEQLCRYVARPPLSSSRLEKISEDKLKVKLKTPWSDGTSFLVLSAISSLAKTFGSHHIFMRIWPNIITENPMTALEVLGHNTQKTVNSSYGHGPCWTWVPVPYCFRDSNVIAFPQIR